jgi:hypothetical protein
MFGLNRLICVGLVCLGLIVQGCEKPTKSPRSSTATDQASTWNLNEASDQYCVYQRANLRTTLDKPATGCSATIKVGSSGIE